MKNEALRTPLGEESFAQPKLSLVPIPSRLTDGRDELNFAEFPLSALTERPDPNQKTIVFEDTIFDKSLNLNLTRKVTITGSNAFGLPTPIDEQVLLALIQLSKLQNFQSKRVFFTRYQLLQLLKWALTGQSYERLDKSLNRWLGVTMYYENAWRDKSNQKWADKSFHMLESLSIEARGERGQSKQEAFQSAGSYFEWNDVVFRSFQSGNVKALNYDFFLSIEGSMAKRLYRFLDKRFWHKEELEFELEKLAFEHVGLSKNTPTGDIKRKFNAAIDELEKKEFLEATPKERRFFKMGPGAWKVMFKKKRENTLLDNEERATNVEVSLEERLAAFGVREAKAAELCSKFPKDLILEKLTVALWMKEKNDSRISGNPAGFLVSSIEGKYEAPKQYQEDLAFKEKKKDTERTKIAELSRAEDKAKRVEELELKRQKMIDEFFSSVTLEARKMIEAEALSLADPSKKKLLSLGGSIAETLKKSIVDRYVLELLSNE